MIKKIYPARNWRRQLAVILPVYNEEENIDSVLSDWAPLARERDGMLIFCNDGSRDGTLELLKGAMEKYDNIIVIDKDNSGHGSTCILGYKWALENGFQWIFQTDSDGQTQANEFPLVWEMRFEHPFIFGHRITRGDGKNRLLFSRILLMSIWCIFGLYIKDANVPFRLMQAGPLKKIIDRVPLGIYLSNAYLAVVIAKHFPIKWVAITFRPRTGGVESVRLWRFFKLGPQVIREFWTHRRSLL